jgi:hypothetical protein
LTTSEDETATWSAQRLYTEAKEAMGESDFAKAVKYFEKLEARYPFGRYAQQAQLEIAYAHWKDAERASDRSRSGYVYRLAVHRRDVDRTAGGRPPPVRTRPVGGHDRYWRAWVLRRTGRACVSWSLPSPWPPIWARASRWIMPCGPAGCLCVWRASWAWTPLP